MKKFSYFWLGFFIYPSFGNTYNTQKVGQICHAQDAPYNYAGLWEINTFGHKICNYWQFLGEKERSLIEPYINEYGEVILEEYEQATDINQGNSDSNQEKATETDEGTFIIIEE